MKWMAFIFTALMMAGTAPLVLGQGELRRDSILCEQGVDGTTEFVGDTRTHITTYAANGRPTEVVISQFTESGEWENFRRRQIAYEGNQMAMLLVQGWNPTAQEWVGRMRRSFVYDDDGMLLQRIVESAPMPGAPLQNSERWGYAYNANKDEEFILYQEWGNGDWQNRRRQQFAYNPAGNLESRTLQNQQNGEWRNLIRRLWVYPTPNAPSPSQPFVEKIITQAWNNTSAEWRNITRRLTDFGTGAAWRSTTFQGWDAASQSWVNQSRELHQLNAQNSMENLLLQEWQEGQWVSLIRESTSRIGLEVITEVDERDTLSGNWGKAKRYGTRFDDEGRVLENIRNQYWDENAETWLNDTESQRYTHFWSEAVVGTREQIPQLQLCKVPNPYRPGTPIHCEVPSGQELTVELFDLLGRPLFRAQYQAGASFSIDKQLPAGSYLLHISQGTQARQVQLITITGL